MTRPMHGDGILWGTVDMSEAKPHQWYYKDAPCTMLAWGYRLGDKSPVVQKVRDSKGKVRLVWRSSDGQYPGLTYELFEHAAGTS